VAKSQDSFDVLAIPSLNRAMVLELVRGEFLPCKEGYLTLLGPLQLSFFDTNPAEMQS
jgi:hypothetical protein